MSQNQKATDAKVQYATAKLAANKVIGNNVVILPEFKEINGKWVAQANCIVENKEKPGTGYISFLNSEETTTRGRTWVNNKWGINIGHTIALAKQGFKAGEVISGRIVTYESTTPSNAKDRTMGLKFLSDILRAMNAPCCTEDGEPIYQERYYSSDENEEDTLLVTANEVELRQIEAEGAKITPKGAATPATTSRLNTVRK